MNDIIDLYTEVILDHNKNPKNFRRLDYNTHQAQGNNPLCGDMLSLELLIKDDLIVDIAFIGEGCAISKASASMMTECLKDKTSKYALEILEDFVAMMLDNPNNLKIEKLLILKGVKEFPMRVKCATLPWHTLKAALNEER